MEEKLKDRLIISVHAGYIGETLKVAIEDELTTVRFGIACNTAKRRIAVNALLVSIYKTCSPLEIVWAHAIRHICVLPAPVLRI